jgi:catechol 2,3-dioxygenase-like lactoylglutathione lyase family enzyme
VFAVEDVAAVCREMESKGFHLTLGPTDLPDWGVRTAHFRDPDGNLIEINQPLQPTKLAGQWR